MFCESIPDLEDSITVRDILAQGMDSLEELQVGKALVWRRKARGLEREVGESGSDVGRRGEWQITRLGGIYRWRSLLRRCGQVARLSLVCPKS